MIILWSIKSISLSAFSFVIQALLIDASTEGKIHYILSCCSKTTRVSLNLTFCLSPTGRKCNPLSSKYCQYSNMQCEFISLWNSPRLQIQSFILIRLPNIYYGGVKWLKRNLYGRSLVVYLNFSNHSRICSSCFLSRKFYRKCIKWYWRSVRLLTWQQT